MNNTGKPPTNKDTSGQWKIPKLIPDPPPIVTSNIKMIEPQKQMNFTPAEKKQKIKTETDERKTANKKMKANKFTYHFSSVTMENKRKIDEMQSTRNTLCKYLDEQFENTTWLVQSIKKLCNRQEKLPMMHEFKFENNLKAVKHNTKVLKNMDTTTRT